MRGTTTRPWLATGAGLVALNALAGAVALATGGMNVGATAAAHFAFHSPAVVRLAVRGRSRHARHREVGR